jgi:hypothetical protein
MQRDELIEQLGALFEQAKLSSDHEVGSAAAVIAALKASLLCGHAGALLRHTKPFCALELKWLGEAIRQSAGS